MTKKTATKKRVAHAAKPRDDVHPAGPKAVTIVPAMGPNVNGLTDLAILAHSTTSPTESPAPDAAKE